MTYDKAWKLLQSPERWTKVYAARDDMGHPVLVSSVKACRFCVMGAVGRVYWRKIGSQAVYPPAERAAYDQHIAAIEARVGVTPLHHWNDAPERTHAEVYNVLKELDI